MRPNSIALILLATITGSWLQAQTQPGTVLWTHDVGDWITCAPALSSDGTVYVGTHSGLVAVTNGSPSPSNYWTFPAGQGRSTAVSSDGKIYFGSDDRKLYAVSPFGTQVWAFAFQSIPPTSAALARDGTIYIQGDGILFALSPSGSTKWSYTNYSNGFGSPSLGADGTVYVGNGGGSTLFALSPAGILKWSYGVGNGNTTGDTAAVGADGTIYFVCGALYAMTPTGTNIWSTATNDFSLSSPVIDESGNIYVEASGHTLCAVGPTGQFLWETLGDGQRYNPPTTPAVDSQGTLYYCASNSVFAMSAAGQVQWSVYGGNTLPGVYLATTSPMLGPDGTIYAALGSKLYAIAGTNILAGSPWPMYRQNSRHTGKVEKPALMEPKKRADANFEFQLFAQLGQTNLIETTTNLNTWTSLTSVVVTTVPQPVVDLTASNHPARFYRSSAP